MKTDNQFIYFEQKEVNNYKLFDHYYPSTNKEKIHQPNTQSKKVKERNIKPNN